MDGRLTYDYEESGGSRARKELSWEGSSAVWRTIDKFLENLIELLAWFLAWSCVIP